MAKKVIHLLRFVGALEIGLLILEAIPALHAHLPIGGTHLSQLGILFGLTFLVIEIHEAMEQLL